MKALRKILDDIKPQFEKGGKYEKFYFLFEAGETFMFAPNETTPDKGAQIRDAVDLKRMMMTVIIALIPCLLFGIWNVGYQHFLAVGEQATIGQEIWVGIKVVLPIVIVSYASGGAVEAIFAVVRKHPINEGFLVTGMLIPLVMPPTVPLWMVSVSTIFAVVIGKEVFGGTGMNILNPALTARVFLFFAYPTYMSGNVWTYLGDKTPVEGYSGATPLAVAAEANIDNTNAVTEMGGFTFGALEESLYSFKNMVIGTIPGSIGETSVIMCLLGAALLIGTGVGSWRVMLSMLLGGIAMGVLMNALSGTFNNQFMGMPVKYQLVMGGFMFGMVYMATDPVSAAHTNRGKVIYGFLIGILALLVRILNPAYPEGVMLAILLMNVFAPLIDHYVVEANKKRRLSRATV